MKEYQVSFDKKRYSEKPTGNEIGKINNCLHTKRIAYDELAYEVGEYGCTFSPAIYNGKRRKEHFIGQQLIALDFDNGVNFSEIKNRANHYRLPILFAYKTFSYIIEHEKFRVVFALSDMICDVFTVETVMAMFMKIFKECDKACKDSSRMFFGGKGLLELADEPIEISWQDMLISFVTYMNDRYGKSHYTREIKKFYNSLGIKYNGILPTIDDGKFIYEEVNSFAPSCNFKNKSRRNVTRNFDWNVLYNKCRLYRDFVSGNAYYYYPELFHMVLTAKPGHSTILQTVRKEYVSIEEAEIDLKVKFLQAVYSERQGVHIIKAQTGIGKTNLYLDYLCQNTGKTFLIAVPMHKLKMEVYHKAISKGIKNIQPVQKPRFRQRNRGFWTG